MRCLDSVTAQTYTDLDIIIIDDGSTDGSGELCDDYASKDARIRVIHQENKGIGATRNIGVEAARGELIDFVDGDDRVFPRMIDSMVDALIRNDAQMAVCRYMQVGDGEDIPVADADTGRTGDGGDADRTEKTGRIGSRLLTRDEALYALVAEDESTIIQNAVWNKLYRRELFMPEDGGEILRYPGHRYEEIVVTARLIARCERIAYIDEPLYVYVTDRSDSIMNRSRLSELLKEQIPSYWERDEFLCSIDRKDLADVHDYIVGKKLLELHTAGRRNGEKNAVRELDGIIRSRYKDRFSKIYDSGDPVVDPHHRLRMRLFLIHPALYDAFTAVNEKLILPLRKL